MKRNLLDFKQSRKKQENGERQRDRACSGAKGEVSAVPEANPKSAVPAEAPVPWGTENLTEEGVVGEHLPGGQQPATQ